MTLQLWYHQSKDVDGGILVPNIQLADVSGAFHVQAGIVIYVNLANLILVGDHLCLPIASVILDDAQLFPDVHNNASSELKTSVRRRSLHRPVHVLDRYEILALIPCSVSAPGAAPSDPRALLECPNGGYSVRCTRNRTLLHSIENMWNAMLFRVKLLHSCDPSLEITSKNFDTSTSTRAKRSRALYRK